ncbi:MAG TPA: transglutaminase-like cysteine peptidase [Stellaceae bacterium]|nr:transglutaminase-like cysteine peptidase [Stellaceae bacterium]
MRPMIGALFGAMALIAAAPPASAAGGEAPGSYPKLFGTNETRSSNIAPFPKWTDMLARHYAEERRGDPPCTPTRFVRCAVQDWLAFLTGERGKPRQSQLAEVNDFINRHPYVLDRINYWETPREFAVHDGDCKDYAIAKYFSLRYLGWPENALRVVVVQDLNLRVAHAVLAVYVGDQILILDNQVRQVVRAETIKHYRPYYSINESHWWLHKPAS